MRPTTQISGTAHLGFGLAFLATLATGLSLDLSSSATSHEDAPWAPWLIASFLGSAAAILTTAAEGRRLIEGVEFMTREQLRALSAWTL